MSSDDIATERDLRALTSQALRDAAAGFELFDQEIGDCCAAFEDGRDGQGREALAGLAQPLGEFANFCRMVMASCGGALEPDTAERMLAAGSRFEEALQVIVAEAAEGNFVGVGDACRFDLTDALHDCRQLFPTMAMELERA